MANPVYERAVTTTGIERSQGWLVEEDKCPKLKQHESCIPDSLSIYQNKDKMYLASSIGGNNQCRNLKLITWRTVSLDTKLCYILQWIIPTF